MRSLSVLSVLAAATAVSAQAPSVAWARGDVFLGVASGNYQVYDNSGVFKETINQGSTGYTTGGAFDSAGNLFTTDFSGSRVISFDGNDPHPVVQNFSTAPGGAVESIAFNSSGDMYVGHAGGDGDVKLFTATGTLVQTFNVATGPRGSDWVDLLADQNTVLYTSEGRQIRRYDVAGNAQLPDFTTLPGSGVAYALRTLPPFDLSTGLLVADTSNVKRLDSTGAVIQTYDATGENQWFSLNLDPNGTSFWAADFASANFYRFNIASGAVEVGPINSGTGGNTVFGVVVKGELTGGNTPPVCVAPTTLQIVVNNANLSFDVSASDVNRGDIVELSILSGMPTGATMTPPLPISGNPVSSRFSWTPDLTQLGFHSVTFRAKDRGGLTEDCTVRIRVDSECFLAYGMNRGDSSLGGNDKLFVDPASIFFIAPVTEWQRPSLNIPNDPQLLDLHIIAQVLMNNSWAFPNDPLKCSHGLDIRIGTGATPFGQHSGLWIDMSQPPMLGGILRVRFGMVQ